MFLPTAVISEPSRLPFQFVRTEHIIKLSLSGRRYLCDQVFKSGIRFQELEPRAGYFVFRIDFYPFNLNTGHSD